MEETKTQQPWMSISPLKGRFSFVPAEAIPAPTGTRPHIVIRPPETAPAVEIVQPLLEDSKKLMSKGDFVGARETLTRAIRAAPRSALAHSFRGYTFLLEGNELRTRAGNNKGLLETAVKTYAAAFPDLDRAIELDSTYAPAFRHRGTVVMAIFQSRKAQGRTDVLASLAVRAVGDLKKAVELDPRSKTSIHALGEAYVAKGDYREAIKQFDHATALDNTYAAPYQGRCEAYRGLGQLDRAYSEGKKSEARDNRPEARRCAESLIVARGR
jgi:tetratricopeptide (TPR) repeat protein